MLSVVIPTRNEMWNVEPLVRRIHAALRDEPFEILFVDDSADDTPNEIRRLQSAYPNVALVQGQGSGLSQAVVLGFKAAGGDMLAVIDADLQHPPETIADLVREARRSGADIVVASRYMLGGDPGGLKGWRRALSLAGRLLARVVLAESRKTTDPLSGFFLAKRDAVADVLDAGGVGWKILLEILVRDRPGMVTDVPYRFSRRKSGESKLGWRTQIDYLLQVLRLFLFRPESTRLLLFGLVGTTGVLVNLGVFSLITNHKATTLGIAIASVIASETAMFWNFAWNAALTWRDRWDRRRWWVYAFKYGIVTDIGTAVTAVCAMLAHVVFGVQWNPFNQAVGIAVSVLITFRLNDRWTWKPKNLPAPENSAKTR